MAFVSQPPKFSYHHAKQRPLQKTTSWIPFATDQWDSLPHPVDWNISCHHRLYQQPDHQMDPISNGCLREPPTGLLSHGSTGAVSYVCVCTCEMNVVSCVCWTCKNWCKYVCVFTLLSTVDPCSAFGPDWYTTDAGCLGEPPRRHQCLRQLAGMYRYKCCVHCCVCCIQQVLCMLWKIKTLKIKTTINTVWCCVRCVCVRRLPEKFRLWTKSGVNATVTAPGTRLQRWPTIGFHLLAKLPPITIIVVV